MSLKSFAIPFCLSLLAFSPLSRAQQTPRYLDPSLPVEQRIDDLLPRMTLEEKISQISDDWGSRGIPRLHIPALLKTEGLHGQSYSTGATIFPQAICTAATFDPDFATQIGHETAVEAKADHIHSSWSPVLDVARDVRWGRVEETYGESPYLVSRMGVAWIEAFQALDMIAVPKHFAGHGQPEGGRDSNDIGLSERTMREIHLPSFRAAVEEAHAGGIMAAYSTWEGVPDNASVELLQRILRQEWGFQGYVVSDCGAPEQFIHKHGIASTEAQAAALAVIAGVDMECGSVYKHGLAEALDEGLVTQEQVDAVVRPILRAKFDLGLFEHPETEQVNFKWIPAYDSPAARALAREDAVDGAVLLRNENNLLPLSRSAKTIAVIGPDSNLAQTGDYSPKPRPGQLITVLDGIKSHAGPGTRIVYAPGLSSPVDTGTGGFAAAIEAAKGADVAVVVVGDNTREGARGTSGENNDSGTLDFPGAQRELIRAIQETGTPVVLVLVNGHPFTLAWEAENIPAILVTWYPGEEGGDATADLLFGDRNPSGRLPVTWPLSVGQLPLHYDYHPSGRKYDYFDLPFRPLYRFGYGLSYTTFKYSNLQITPKADDPGYVTVTADIQNTGNRDGDEVAQLYYTDVVASVSTPVVELGGVQRVSLKRGETKRVSFQLTPYQLSLLDANMVRRVEPGVFRIHVGGVCPDVPKGVNDDRKKKIGFYNPAEGISGEFDEPKAYAAEFTYAFNAPAQAKGGEAFPATLTVTNKGNLTDITVPKLYAGRPVDSWGFELKPGESKSHVFHPAMYQTGELAMVAKDQMVSRYIAVQQAPARLDLTNVRTKIDDDDVIHITGRARNAGGAPYAGGIPLVVDGRLAQGTQTVNLRPGETVPFALAFPFKSTGMHTVQVADLPAQQIVAPGGLAFGLTNPLVYLKCDEGQGSTVRNEITGTGMAIHGSPAWVPGHEGTALHLTSPDMDIDAGNIDLYRKAFTLSAWVKIDALGNDGDLALFGGKAPMGADQDNTGTQLHAGLQHGKPYLGFMGRDIGGGSAVPLGQWANVAFTYDPVALKGSLYVDGKLVKTAAQKPYTGPLETIGQCPFLQHGSFALDDVAVIQSCLTPAMVDALASGGMESLLTGDYKSEWRPLSGTPSRMEASADLPPGSRASILVQVGGQNGKSPVEQEIPLETGDRVYPFSMPKPGSEVRIEIKMTAGNWKAMPVIHSVEIAGVPGSVRWFSPKDWAQGTTSPALTIDYGQP
ncbi:MAG TPA: glycoside hydrolase family 3 N-terminal domain-containing protein [Chthoniobacteraceae bacterium]|jgi:beta-glucosidase|nr:glycoside hydrolase family 3 N-terminal domain-containing protein [Chthoniobacteraceae bacterium]